MKRGSKRAFGDARITSQASGRLTPAPITGPLTAATDGIVNPASARYAGVHVAQRGPGVEQVVDRPAGTEGRGSGGEHEGADRRVGGGLVDRLRQLHGDLEREGVAAGRVVEGHDGDVAVALEPDSGVVRVHGPSIVRPTSGRVRMARWSSSRATRSPRIRSRLDHPIIDADGHAIEYLPLVRDILREQAGDDAVAVMDLVTGGAAAIARPLARADARRRAHPHVVVGSARRATRSTAAPRSCPICSRRGSPSSASTTRSSTRRTGWCPPRSTTPPSGCRWRARSTRSTRRRSATTRETLTPVGIIPMHTPEEAIAELDHATGELGLKAFMFGGPISRPAPGVDPPSRAARWLDSLGLDSLYDYDPVWQRCVDLGVSPTFHTAAMGWTIRASVEQLRVQPHRDVRDRRRDARAVAVHGRRAAAVPARCGSRSRRAAWRGRPRCCANLVGHWEKRNRDAVEHYNPAHLDRAQVASLFEEYGSARYRERLDQLDAGLRMLSLPDEDPATLDEFARCGITDADDIRDGVHARVPLRLRGRRPDDRAGVRSAPYGRPRLKALFASDIGHWDVPDIREVLPEAWELVEDGDATEADFRALTFEHAVSLWATHQPGVLRRHVGRGRGARELERVGAPG